MYKSSNNICIKYVATLLLQPLFFPSLVVNIIVGNCKNLMENYRISLSFKLEVTVV